MAGFTKLFSCIVTSSIWTADDRTLRVWIALLSQADAKGIVEGSVPGFASLCRMSIDDFEAALLVLAGPDQYSRTPDNDGRRIEAIQGGWQILNYAAYREKGQDKDGSRAAYMRKYRTIGPIKRVTTVTCNTEAEAEERSIPAPLPSRAAPGEKKGKSRLPESDQAKRLAGIFHRRLTTPWDRREIAALKEAGTINPEDLAAVEAYYAAHWPPEREKNILRHALLTFLNNIATEIDRAHAWRAKHKPRQNGNTPDPPGWREFIVKARNGEYIPHSRAPDYNRTDFLREQRSAHHPSTPVPLPAPSGPRNKGFLTHPVLCSHNSAQSGS